MEIKKVKTPIVKTKMSNTANGGMYRKYWKKLACINTMLTNKLEEKPYWTTYQDEQQSKKGHLKNRAQIYTFPDKNGCKQAVYKSFFWGPRHLKHTW